VLGPCSAGPAPGAAGGDVGLALLRRIAGEYSSYSGSGPICALGGRSTVELRTAPEPPRMEVLGVTLESTDGAEGEGRVEEGILVAPSVVIAELLLEPQLVHGAVTDAGLVKTGR